MEIIDTNNLLASCKKIYVTKTPISIVDQEFMGEIKINGITHDLYNINNCNVALYKSPIAKLLTTDTQLYEIEDFSLKEFENVDALYDHLTFLNHTPQHDGKALRINFRELCDQLINNNDMNIYKLFIDKMKEITEDVNNDMIYMCIGAKMNDPNDDIYKSARFLINYVDFDKSLELLTFNIVNILIDMFEYHGNLYESSTNTIYIEKLNANFIYHTHKFNMLMPSADNLSNKKPEYILSKSISFFIEQLESLINNFLDKRNCFVVNNMALFKLPPTNMTGDLFPEFMDMCKRLHNKYINKDDEDFIHTPFLLMTTQFEGSFNSKTQQKKYYYYDNKHNSDMDAYFNISLKEEMDKDPTLSKFFAYYAKKIY